VATVTASCTRRLISETTKGLSGVKQTEPRSFFGLRLLSGTVGDINLPGVVCRNRQDSLVRHPPLLRISALGHTSGDVEMIIVKHQVYGQVNANQAGDYADQPEGQ